MGNQAVDHYMEDNSEGNLPWMPPDLLPEEKDDWREGWRYEIEFFINSQNLVTPEQLPHNIRVLRAQILQLGPNPPDTLDLERRAAQVDRCLLTEVDPEQWDFALTLFQEEFGEGYEVLLEEFVGHVVHTPMTWFERFCRNIPHGIIPTFVPIEEMFRRIALDGRLAVHRPSVVGAAMVTYLIGETAAFPYLCGYDLFDYCAALGQLADLFGI